MKRLSKALVKFDPRLEIFEIDYDSVAESQSISVAEAHKFIDYVEVNTPEEAEDYIQFCIGREVVSISYGFGSSVEFIERIMEYVAFICKETGYFLYDPQDESVFDPLHPIPLTSEENKSWSENTEVDFMKDRIASTENIAIAIWEELEKPIRKLGAELYCVKLEETENNFVEYFGNKPWSVRREAWSVSGEQWRVNQ